MDQHKGEYMIIIFFINIYAVNIIQSEIYISLNINVFYIFVLCTQNQNFKIIYL